MTDARPEPEQRSGENLFRVLTSHARAQTTARLTIVAGGGVLVAAVGFALLHGWWPLGMLGVSLASFGLWGLTARHVDGLRRGNDAPRAIGAWQSLLPALALIGIVGAGLCVAGLFGRCYTGTSAGTYGMSQCYYDGRWRLDCPPKATLLLSDDGVYAAVIDTLYPAGMGLADHVYLLSHTTLGAQQGISAEGLRELLRSVLPGMPRELAEDFVSLNAQSVNLRPLRTVRATQVFVDLNAGQVSRDNSTGPDGSTATLVVPEWYLSLSRVARDPSENWALVYAETYANAKVGLTAFVLLRRQGDLWAVVHVVPV